MVVVAPTGYSSAECANTMVSIQMPLRKSNMPNELAVRGLVPSMKCPPLRRDHRGSGRCRIRAQDVKSYKIVINKYNAFLRFCQSKTDSLQKSPPGAEKVYHTRCPCAMNGSKSHLSAQVGCKFMLHICAIKTCIQLRNAVY